MPSLGHRESRGLCWGGEARQIVLSLGFRTWVQELSRCPDTWVSCAGQSVSSCVLPYEKVLGWGMGNTQIHSLDVHRMGVIRRSWISAELGFSVIQPTFESRPGLFWGCSGECLIFFKCQQFFWWYVILCISFLTNNLLLVLPLGTVGMFSVWWCSRDFMASCRIFLDSNYSLDHSHCRRSSLTWCFSHLSFPECILFR